MTTTVELKDLLDEEQRDEVQAIVSQIMAGNVDGKVLRTYLRTQRESLEARGILPDYLYYMICWKLELPL